MAARAAPSRRARTGSWTWTANGETDTSYATDRRGADGDRGTRRRAGDLVYDARRLTLPLHGGGTGTERPETHDWFYMLGRLDVLGWDHALAWLCQIAALACMLGGLVWAGVLLRQQRRVV